MQPWRIGPWRLMRSSTCSVWGWCFFGCQRSWGFSLNLEKILYNTLNGNPLQNLTFCAFFCSNPCRHLCGWRWWYTMLAICQQFLRPGCWKKQPCAVNGIIMEAVPAGVWSVWIFCRRWPCREKCEICLLQHCPAGHQLWQDDCTKRQAEQLRHDNSSRPSEPRQTLKNFEIFKVQKANKTLGLDADHPLLLRLCIWVLLNANPSGFLALFAVVCTSFSAINVGTSKRTPATPWGNCALPHVQASWPAI